MVRGEIILPDSDKESAAGLRGYLVFPVQNALKIIVVYLYLGIYSNLGYHFVTSVILSAIVFLSAARFRKPYVFAAAYVLQFIYIEINLLYNLNSHSFLHVEYATLFEEGLEAYKFGALPLDMTLMTMLPHLIDLPLFVVIMREYSTMQKSLTDKGINRMSFISACVVLLAGVYSWIFISDESIVPETSKYRYDLNIVERYGLMAHNIHDLLTYSTERKITYGGTFLVKRRLPERFNIITIQVESLDANVINYIYEGRYIAPFLHELSQKSIYYPYTMSYHLAGGTSDSEISVVNSMEPLNGFPTIESKRYDYPNSFIKILSKEAYTPYAFHGNKASYFNREYAYAQMGFRTFYAIERMGLPQEGWGVSDRNVFYFVLQKLSSQQGPFIFHIITMSSHEPFTNILSYSREPWKNLYDDVPDKLTMNYFRSMSYVDDVLKEFISKAKNMKNTYIFIYGDHTPVVIKKHIFRRAFFRQEGKEFEFVPLFILTPDERVYREGYKVACFLDIAATALSASGVPFTFRSDGVNLLETPIPDKKIPYLDGSYSRKYLFGKINGKQ